MLKKLAIFSDGCVQRSCEANVDTGRTGPVTRVSHRYIVSTGACTLAHLTTAHFLFQNGLSEDNYSGPLEVFPTYCQYVDY